jgi:hypothetical protein
MRKFSVTDWQYLVFWLVLLSLNPAFARETSCSISSASARGEGGNLPILTVYKGSGLNISFLPLSKRVTKVWLDDPSRITVDFDAPLKRGASVIHLKRIEPVNFPRVPKSGSTLLTVIAEGASGAGEEARNNGRERYQFRVTYGEKGQPPCYGYDVLPDPVALSNPNGSTLEEESLLREGLAIALRRGTISADAGNTVLETRVRRYIELRKRGVEGEAARQRAKVSRAFLDRLEELALRGRAVRERRVSEESISGRSFPEESSGESDGYGFWESWLDEEFF